jgi:hypothetical protein
MYVSGRFINFNVFNRLSWSQVVEWKSRQCHQFSNVLCDKHPSLRKSLSVNWWKTSSDIH